jgi:hypothetical protein
MSPEQAVAQVVDIIDEHATETERALALAMALRDRLVAEDEPTNAALAGMLVDQLAGAPEGTIKDCLNALLARCQPQAA